MLLNSPCKSNKYANVDSRILNKQTKRYLHVLETLSSPHLHPLVLCASVNRFVFVYFCVFVPDDHL